MGRTRKARMVMVRMDDHMFREVEEAAKQCGSNRADMLRRAWKTVRIMYSGIPFWEMTLPLTQLERIVQKHEEDARRITGKNPGERSA